MSKITCPCCGGQKATQINDHEYCCEYCGNTFTPTTPDNKDTAQPSQVVAPPPVAFQPTATPPIASQSIATPHAKAFANGNIQNTTNQKSRTTAAILAILLGGLGVHQFYLGNTKTGFVYLLLCWTYIPAFIAFIEFIMLLTQSDEDFVVKPKLVF